MPRAGVPGEPNMSDRDDTLIPLHELNKTPPTTVDWRSAAPIDVDGLEAELRRNVRGEVRFDAGSKAMYAVDASNYRQVPIGVVIPRSKEDVVQTVAACRKFGCASSFARRAAPVWPASAATSLSSLIGRSTCTVCWR